MPLIIIFIALSIVNVIFSTVRSLVTINSGKWVASIVSAGYFAFYNIVLIYTVLDFPLWQKCAITFGCNLVGVFIVKLIEEKSRKDKLWKIEATCPSAEADHLMDALEACDIPYYYVDIEKYHIFGIFCATQKESAMVKSILGRFNVKYFVSESQVL